MAAETPRAVADRELARLARAYGVATWYEDWRGERRTINPDTIVTVLGALGVDAGSRAAVREALAAVQAGQRPGAVPSTVVAVPGRRPPAVPEGRLFAEDGSERAVRAALPDDLAPGYYRLATEDGAGTVIVPPRRLPPPPRGWGWMLQLYALRSTDSWGIGDFSDLARFSGWAAGTGADLVLLNPLHAVVPSRPVPASPYSPSSRRYVNPIYLGVERTEAYRRADSAMRARVDALRPDRDPGLIDYDTVWRAKLDALELLWSEEPRPDVDADPALRDYTTYCALAERHGTDWRGWPAQLRRPDDPAVARARAELADRVAFHAWLQQQSQAQLGEAADAGRGMAVGLVHDLAVGIDAGGADAWALQDAIAAGVSVGAPPDSFNQLGQDWGLAAWRPDRLAATGYQPLRELFGAAFRHGGGLRVDHVAGLWRLWWVPSGATADQGTYVHYDAEAMLAVLTLEAHRGGAVVIGEDLGTVRAEVTRGLHGRNMLSSAVLWFLRDGQDADPPFVPPRRWPRAALASISTHDLPTAAGFLTGEHVRVRSDLNLLAHGEQAEREQYESDRRELLRLLAAEGLIEGEAGMDELVLALHAVLGRAPSRLVVASPYDVLGEVRQPNLPGTVDQYPNWRIPLPATLDELMADPRVAAVIKVLDRDR